MRKWLTQMWMKNAEFIAVERATKERDSLTIIQSTEKEAVVNSINNNRQSTEHGPTWGRELQRRL